MSLSPFLSSNQTTFTVSFYGIQQHFSLIRSKAIWLFWLDPRLLHASHDVGYLEALMGEFVEG